MNVIERVLWTRLCLGVLWFCTVRCKNFVPKKFWVLLRCCIPANQAVRCWVPIWYSDLRCICIWKVNYECCLMRQEMALSASFMLLVKHNWLLDLYYRSTVILNRLYVVEFSSKDRIKAYLIDYFYLNEWLDEGNITRLFSYIWNTSLNIFLTTLFPCGNPSDYHLLVHTTGLEPTKTARYLGY